MAPAVGRSTSLSEPLSSWVKNHSSDTELVASPLDSVIDAGRVVTALPTAAARTSARSTQTTPYSRSPASPSPGTMNA